MSDRNLWGTLYLFSSPQWDGDAILKQTERAAGAELTVVMDGLLQDHLQAAEWLAANDLIGAVHELDCTVEEKNINLLWTIVAAFKNLKTLLIDQLAMDHDIFPILEDDVHIDLPNLRTLRLQYVNMPWNHLSLPSLETIWINIGTGLVGPAIQFLLLGLVNLPRLAKLTVVLDLDELILYNDDRLEDSIPKHSVFLPNLKELNVGNVFDYHLKMILNAIRAPELTKLMVYGKEDALTDRAWTDVDPSFPKLESLYLGGWHDLGAPLSRILTDQPSSLTYLNLVATEKIKPTQIVSAFTKLRLPHLTHLRTHDIPLSHVRRMVESQPSVGIVGVEISDVGLGSGASEEAFRRLETDLEWMRQHTRFTLFGELYYRKLYASWAQKLRNDAMVDTEAKHYEKWWHMESMG